MDISTTIYIEIYLIECRKIAPPPPFKIDFYSKIEALSGNMIRDDWINKLFFFYFRKYRSLKNIFIFKSINLHIR